MAQPEIQSRPPVVLLGVDHEWSARSLDSILTPSGYAVVRASSRKLTLDLARSTRPDAIIIEASSMLDDGLELCRELRADALVGPSTPIIVTAVDRAARGDRLAALAAGAWQYCAQPLDAESLLVQLRTFVDAKRTCDQYRSESLLDELTGLYSLHGLARRARELGAHAQRRHEPLACLALTPELSIAGGPTQSDSDDSLVRHVASVLRAGVRLADAVGRLGPLEFGIIAPDTTHAGTLALIDRLCAAFDSPLVPADVAPRTVRLQVGYHEALDLAESPVDAVEMLLRATAALRYVRSRADGTSVQSFEQVPSPLP